MKNLFEPSSAREIKDRIRRLTPENERQWGQMAVAQMLAHCSAWMEIAAGVDRPPRSLLGRLVGRFAKASILGEQPPARNMPTMKGLIVSDERAFADEQQNLLAGIDRFAAGGPEQCTRHPHSFFGPLTPREWAILGYKHLDHHLRQFGA
ncbi:MAG: DUF1569 domain-containing protein [Deinococcales bacterium]